MLDALKGAASPFVPPRPPPWTVEPLDAGYKVLDANGQVLAYVYGLDDSRDARIANSLTRDEARRIASNIVKLPELLRGQKGPYRVG